jgi:hypothetical protein
MNAKGVTTSATRMSQKTRRLYLSLNSDPIS